MQTARFTYDVATAPTRVDLRDVAAGWGAFEIRLDGLESGDTVQQAVFTAQIDGSANTITKQITASESDDGVITSATTTPRSRTLTFTLTAADIAALAGATYPYAIRVWVSRGGESRDREVIVGNITARAARVTIDEVSAVAAIVVSPATATGSVGQTDQLAAVAQDVYGATVPGVTFTWSSANTTVATVDQSGLVTYVAPGVVTITARAHGVSGTAEVTSNSAGFIAPADGDYIAFDAGAGVWEAEDPETRFYTQALVDSKDAASVATAAADATTKANAAQAAAIAAAATDATTKANAAQAAAATDATTKADAAQAAAIAAAATDATTKANAAQAAAATDATTKANAALATATAYVDAAPPDGGRTVATLASFLLNNAVWNVKDLGAVGDGVTDDSTAIVNTIAQATAAGGGTVFFPKGTYLVKRPLIVTSHVHLVGEGRGLTTITKPAAVKTTLTANASTGATSVQVANITGLAVGMGISMQSTGATEWDTTQAIITGITPGAGTTGTVAFTRGGSGGLVATLTTGASASLCTSFPFVTNTNAWGKLVTNPTAEVNIVVRGITFDGNKSANDPGYGTSIAGTEFDFTISCIHWLKVQRCRVLECEIKNSPADGVSDQGDRSGAFFAGDNVIDGCYIHDCARHATHLGSNISGGLITRNHLASCPGYAMFYCAAVTHTKFTFNIVRNCAHGAAIIDYRDTDNIISGNTIHTPTAWAIDASSGDGTGGRLTITNNTIIGGNGITLDQPDSVIANNTFDLRGGGGICIRLGAFGDRASVIGNKAFGASSGYFLSILNGCADARIIGNSASTFDTACVIEGATRMVAVGNHWSSMLNNNGWWFLNNASTDCIIRNELNTLTTPVLETLAPVRLVYEGLGDNGTSDPASGGNWNGISGKRWNGTMVRWNSGGGEKISIFYQGVGWTALN